MSVARDGFELLDGVLSVQDAARYLELLGELDLEPLRGGIRRIEQRLPEVAALANSSRLMELMRPHLSGQPALVRAIYFDKSPENNWFVTWHQDRTVAVSDRFDLQGWGPWSVKAGACHVQPPLDVLDDMVTIRIHLDAATMANGCLKVIPGSHSLGLISADKVLEYVDVEQVVYCESPIGGAVVMRPHILHASEKAVSDAPRRILHFEYSSFQLPQGIRWAA